MMRWTLGLCCVFLLAGTLSPAQVLAEDEGLADLDRAVDAKLNATSVPELGRVIDYWHSALRKGLDEANEEFVEKLLASTLIQRASAIGEAILEPTASIHKSFSRLPSAIERLPI